VAARKSPFASLREPDDITVPARDAAKQVLENFEAERSEHAAAERAKRRPLLDWARNVPTARHGSLRFDDFPFQLELYGPEATHARELGFKKCTQGGLSEWALRVGLFHADFGRTAMYVFPEDTHLRAFSNMRIKPVIRNSEYLRSRMDSDAVDNVTLKKVGLGFIAFRGSQSATGLMSVDADVLILDEYDSLEVENLGEAEQRVTGPLSLGIIRRLGVPSVPGWGIDKFFTDGDQRAWTVKCAECDEWNRLEGVDGWLRNVDREREIVVCRRCREPLDVRKGGEWVARHPERDVRTYTLPKYAIHGVNIAGIVARSKKTRPIDVEKFHRNDLGEAFTPAEGRLSREAILACVHGDLMPLEGLTSARLVTMGVDAKGTGDLHYTVREHIDEYRVRIVAVGIVRTFAALDHLMDLYGVNMAAVDHMPEWQQARAFCNRHPGRAYAVGFLTGKDARNAVKLDVPMLVDDEARTALVRRVQVLDTMLDAYRRQWVLLPPLEALSPEFPDHLQAVIRVTEDAPTGEKKVFYRSIADDDFALAEAYNVMAAELWYRTQGLAMVQLEQTQARPHGDAIDYASSRLSDPSSDGDVYRPGFGDRDEFDPGV
jgi:hypothetical protein